jgi:hypothetical protein
MTRDRVYQGFVKAWLLALVLGLVACSKGPTDDEITKAIQASYYADPQVRDEKIAIDVKNGEVTLSGDASSDAARLQAYKLAAQTGGVKKVNDQMEVSTARAGRGLEHAARGEGSARGAASAPRARETTVPAGTSIRVQTIDAISSKTGQIGQAYRASLADPIVAGDRVVVPKGADVFVKVTAAKAAGRIKGSSELTLALDHLEYKGNSYPLESSAVKEASKSRGKETAMRTGLGAAIGAGIGAIAGGGKGAAIGAGVGGGGAMAYQAFTHGKEVNVPSETLLDFTLAQPVRIVLPPGR